jgi:Acyl-protein synthetase, LuxE
MALSLDSISNPLDFFNYSKDEVYSLDADDVRNYQLRVIAQRFDDLRQKVVYLDKLGREHGIDRITSFDDAVKLVANPGKLYKSYDVEWLDSGRFDLMTDWIDQFTAADLSQVDASRCVRIDDWCQALEEQAGVCIRHSSGTSGTLTFMPRKIGEEDAIPMNWMWQLQGWGKDPDLSLKKGANNDITVFYPHARRLRRPQTAIFDYFEKSYTDKLVKTVIDYQSPDLARFAGMKRNFLENGGRLEEFLVGPHYQQLDKEQAEFDAAFGQRYAAWIADIMTNFQGQRIMLFTFTEMIYDMGQALKARNQRQVFRDNSIIICAGGLKTRDSLPEGWLQETCDILGVPKSSFKTIYGMTEIMPQSFQCPAGHHHPDPWMVLLLIDPETGTPLPREGVQSGHIAMFDPFAESYWSGLITGDQGTMNYSDCCDCGRPGPFLQGEVSRA